MIISIIVAILKDNCIGSNNTIPWYLPNDLRYFKSKTLGHHLLVGRKTYESLEKKLKDRVLIVVTENKDYKVKDRDVHVVHSVEKGIKLAQDAGEKELFVIGGKQIYEKVTDMRIVHKVYMTKIKSKLLEGSGVYLEPSINYSSFREVWRICNEADSQHEFAYDFVEYEKVNKKIAKIWAQTPSCRTPFYEENRI